MSDSVNNAFDETLAEGVGKQLLNSALGATSPLNNLARYMTGARAIIKVNGKLFGFAFGVSYNIQTNAEENWTIDDYTPYELMPSKMVVNGTIGMFHIPGKGPARELVQANLLSYLMHRYITIEISDQMTGQLIFRTDRAMITGKSQTMTAGEISTIQLTWKAIGWVDEMTPKLSDGADSDSKGKDGSGNPISNAINGAINAVKNLF
jgi:hypothetical protein